MGQQPAIFAAEGEEGGGRCDMHAGTHRAHGRQKTQTNRDARRKGPAASSRCISVGEGEHRAKPRRNTCSFPAQFPLSFIALLAFTRLAVRPSAGAGMREPRASRTSAPARRGALQAAQGRRDKGPRARALAKRMRRAGVPLEMLLLRRARRRFFETMNSAENASTSRTRTTPWVTQSLGARGVFRNARRRWRA